MSMKRMSNMLKAMHGQAVEIGWFESNLYNTGVPVATIAVTNEFGDPAQKIPARPAMRRAFVEGSRTIGDRMNSWLPRYVAGELTVKNLLYRVGVHYEAAISDSILNGGWKHNAPFTVAKKGFDKPLVESGIMHQSVTHNITRGES